MSMAMELRVGGTTGGGSWWKVYGLGVQLGILRLMGRRGDRLVGRVGTGDITGDGGSGGGGGEGDRGIGGAGSNGGDGGDVE